MSEQQALPAYDYLLNKLVESRNSSVESVGELDKIFLFLAERAK